MNLRLAQNEDIRIPDPSESEKSDTSSQTYKPGDVIKPGEINRSPGDIIIVESSPTPLTPPPPNPPLLFSSTQSMIAGAILLVLAIIFFFIKRGLENNLIANQSRPRRATQAGWMFFLLLFCVAITLVLTFLSNRPLWNALPIFYWSMVATDVIILVAFLIVYSGARRSARIP